MSASNELNLLMGLGLEGERFLYPGRDDSAGGFSRFTKALVEEASGSAAMLPSLRMVRGVTVEGCRAVVERHKLLAPHAVWLVDEVHEGREASAARLGDCGLFLGTRSALEHRLWRSAYEYGRWALDLGHMRDVANADLHLASVHTASEGLCDQSPRACVFWSEFDLDVGHELSCRPNSDGSNVATPTALLEGLSSVLYPPPNPPPPEAPKPPPLPLPPPNSVRCNFAAVPTAANRKVNFKGNEGVIMANEACWRFGSTWPPFVAHRDVYEENAECGIPSDGAPLGRTRSVQWDGGFRQPLLSDAGAVDWAGQNTNDCPVLERLRMLHSDDTAWSLPSEHELNDPTYCLDSTGYNPKYLPIVCEVGTQARAHFPTSPRATVPLPRSWLGATSRSVRGPWEWPSGDLGDEFRASFADRPLRALCPI